MKGRLVGLGLMSLSISIACAIDIDSNSIPDFDSNWLFLRGNIPGAATTALDDSSWRTVEIPHDWAIEDLPGTTSPFDAEVENGVASGFTQGGNAWYRKHFNVADTINSRYTLLIEGVYMNADIYINGKKAANQFYGYTPLDIDITSFLLPGEDNLIAVNVNSPSVTSRWYSGAGLYRPIHLIRTPLVHLDTYGTKISSPIADSISATLRLITPVVNATRSTASSSLSWCISDPDGNIIWSHEETVHTIGGQRLEVEAIVPVSAPQLWSPETPYRYTLVTTVCDKSSGNKQTMCQKFGIRNLCFDPNRGFLLNGRPTLLKGGCIHHDNGALGAKTYPRAETRKVELLRSAGHNALRMSHNPPSTALLDACDSIGMMVIDEAFDVWIYGHFDGDYSCRFTDLWQQDLSAMIRRDYNHPSVIMWSIGNEIKKNDTPEIFEWSARIAEFTRNLDPSRPVTAGVNSITKRKEPLLRTLDVAGYNYSPAYYMKGHEANPNQLIYASESYASEVEKYWKYVEKYDWIIGDFVWTAWDYIGEASIGWYGYDLRQDFYPWYMAYCGDFDINGKRRPHSYHREALWSDSTVLSIAVGPPTPSFPQNPLKQKWSIWDAPDEVDFWSFPGEEGKKSTVAVYSNCTEVELFLNGVSLGRKKPMKAGRFEWDVPYQPGTLLAKGYNSGLCTAENSLSTPSEPVAINVVADRTDLVADNRDLSYINVRLIDENGETVPHHDERVYFEITGPATIIGVSNSNPMSTESFTSDSRLTWRGECMAVLKTGHDIGDVIVKVHTDSGLESEIKLNIF